MVSALPESVSQLVIHCGVSTDALEKIPSSIKHICLVSRTTNETLDLLDEWNEFFIFKAPIPKITINNAFLYEARAELSERSLWFKNELKMADYDAADEEYQSDDCSNYSSSSNSSNSSHSGNFLESDDEQQSKTSAVKRQRM
jgi:hypothetical protein